MNQSAFTVSRQCDLLIFDASAYPPVFRDGEFVVLRPESVRAVVEVKSALTIPVVRDVVEAFVDFGEKWRETQEFYRTHHQALTRTPELAAMAWSIKTRANGKPLTNAANVR